MVEVRNIRVFSLDRDAISLTWEIAETTEGLSTYSTVVLRSLSAAGPYTPVSPSLNAGDMFEFEDRGPNQLSKWREFFYRIRLTKGSNTYEFGSVPYTDILQHGLDPGGVSMAAVPDLEALEAIRRMELVAQEYAGRKVLFVPLRRWGQRCSDCWDPLKRRVKSSQCLSCFSTGFTGGYLHPRVGRVITIPDEKLTALTSLLAMEPHDIARWVPPSVRLSPADLMIDTENRRWTVIQVKRNTKGDALTWQVVQLRELSRDQVEYRIPIVWPEDNVSVAPHRQYIRATDIDSYREAANRLGMGNVEANQIRGFKTDQDGT